MTDLLPFRFEVGPIVADSAADAADWALGRSLRWTFTMNGERVHARRCGIRGAYASAWALGSDEYAPSIPDTLLPPSVLADLDDLVSGRWAAHIIECRRLCGDPAVPALRPLRPDADAGHIYLVKSRDKVKIGFTSGDPEARLRALQTGSAHRLRLVNVIRGTAKEERELHRLFADLRAGGEWFYERRKIYDVFMVLGQDSTRRP